MPNETEQTVGGASAFQRHWFTAVGFIACAIRGKLDRYAYLLAQAKFETADYSSHWFSVEKNPWCVQAGTLFPRQKGSVPGDVGNVGVYGSFWSAWLDRLDWDDKRQVTMTGSCWDYAAAVVTQGRWFGANSTADKAARYADGVASYYHTVPGWARAVTWVASDSPDSVAPIGTSVLVIGIIILLFMALFAWLTKRK
jgi:hypothetical protein